MATRYQRLDYRDYSACTLLNGIESGIRVQWQLMHENRWAVKTGGPERPDYMRDIYRQSAYVHKQILRELLDIRRDAR